MHIQIGPIRYEVVEVAELASAKGELYGDIDYSKCRIRIAAESDAQVKRVTLWHEILHGILTGAAQTEDHNEAHIDALAHGIILLLRDNPALRGGDA
jgi:hypothetical protein